MTLFFWVIGWCAGIVMAARLAEPSGMWWIAAGGAALGVIVSRRKPRARLAFACVLAGALGGLRYDAVRPETGPGTLSHYNGAGRVTLTGIIVDDPDVRDAHVKVRVEAESLEVGDRRVEVRGLALVNAPRYGGYAYGDRVRVEGVPVTPPEMDTFSYRDYLARSGVYTFIPGADVAMIGSGGGDPLLRALFDLRGRARAVITNALPEPQASLLVGILLGDEAGIPPDVVDAFNATGASHVIAISGFNMTILAALVQRILRGALSERKAAAAGIAIIALYTVLVGANAAVVRAALMSGLLVVATALRRRTHVPTSLAFAALIMSALNPHVLWDVGFQLSFAAVMGLALFVDPLEAAFRRGFGRFLSRERVERLIALLSEPLIVTLAAQIATLPLIAFYFGRLSIASFPVNFLILPVQSYLMLLGGAAALIGLVSAGFAAPLFALDWGLLAWTTGVVTAFARFDWANLQLQLAEGVIIAYYGALLAYVVVSGLYPRWRANAGTILRRQGARMAALGAGVIVLALFADALGHRADGCLRVTFLDVGEGHAVFMQMPGGARVLVNGGAYPTRLAAAVAGQLPAMVQNIDLLVITGPDAEQIGALPALLERYTVGAALVTGLESGSPEWAALTARLTESGIPKAAVWAGYRVDFGDGAWIEIANPQRKPHPKADPGVHGMAIKAGYGDARFFIAGGLDEDGAAALLGSGRWLGATVLELPAGAWKAFGGEDFLAAVGPSAAVIEVVAGDSRTYPGAELVGRLGDAPLFRTDRDGSVTFVTDGREMWGYPAR